MCLSIKAECIRYDVKREMDMDWNGGYSRYIGWVGNVDLGVAFCVSVQYWD